LTEAPAADAEWEAADAPVCFVEAGVLVDERGREVDGVSDRFPFGAFSEV